MNVFDGNTRSIDLLGVQVWLAVGSVNTIDGFAVTGAGGGAWIAAVKLSDAVSPLLSVAVTLIVRLYAVAGALPLKVSVEALKESCARQCLTIGQCGCVGELLALRIGESVSRQRKGDRHALNQCLSRRLRRQNWCADDRDRE